MCPAPSEQYGLMSSVMNDMSYGRGMGVPDGDTYDYDKEVDRQPGVFDYDDPRDYEAWCTWNYVDDDKG